MNINELYVNEIKKNLIYKHAAVLIGSGFSRNADRVDGTDTHMPDWFGLADEFCRKLGFGDTEKKYADTLTLAQEIEEMYGRPFLDNLLREQMLDDQYMPSKIHIDLMRLPWSDVFTTNYDTLLERACQRITENRYHIVVNQNDLLYSSGQARIIKLHGSFPSNGPFIITEEDFRTYPYDHAPFVNTVQQSLLENIFILIGFSGSDPNFLKWIGWIHDNLGLKNSPKIFMISHTGESEVKAKMLAAKNIEVIVLNDIDKYKDNSYKKALENFLSDLINYVNEWKNTKFLWPDFSASYNERSGKELLKVLQKTHAEYPGWITIPYKKHKIIDHILFKVDFFLMTAQKKEENELEICSEFCWFSRMIGRPLFNNTIPSIQKVLERNSEFSCNEIFIDIQLYILYSYRIQGLDDEWDSLYSDLLKKNGEEKGLLYISLMYEKAMHLIYTLQWQSFEEAVSMIPADNEHGEWLLKKCSLLAMLGRYEEAEKLLEGCIFYVRRIILESKETKTNVRYVSLEGCLVSLYNHIKQAHRVSKGNLLGNNNDQEQPLKKDYENDYIWQIENDRFTGVLSKEYVYTPNERRIPAFDIGLMTIHNKTGDDSNAINAYEFISFREMTGHPFQIGYVTNKEGAEGTALRVNRYSMMIPLILSLLSSDNKIVESSFTRLEIARMSISDVDILMDKCLSLLYFSMDYYASKNHANIYETDLMEYPLKVMPEILSRLCVICSQEKYDKMVDLLIYIYQFKDKDIIKNVNKLTQRVVQYMPIEAVKRNADKFWKFNLMPTNPHLNKEFPDPFCGLWSRLAKHEELGLLPMNDEQVKLFDVILGKSTEKEYHDTAIMRASFIYKIYSLSDIQKSKFKSVIWNEENLNEFGLPHLGSFYCVLADEFPHDKENKEILESAEKFIVNEFKKSIEQGVLQNYDNHFQMAHRVVEKVEITEDKLNKATKLAVALCNIFDKFYVSYFGKNDARKGLGHVDELMGEIILRSGLANSEKSYHNKDINEIVNVLDKYGVPHALLTWCITDSNRDEAITRSLFRGDSNFVHNANQAIYFLTQYNISVSEKLKTCLIDSIYTAISYQVNGFVLGLEYLIGADLLTDEQCQQIAESLYKFDEMTQLTDTDTNDTVSGKLIMRKVTSILAHTLYEWFKRNSKTIPEGVAHWKTISESPEEFAEIRLCWE